MKKDKTPPLEGWQPVKAVLEITTTDFQTMADLMSTYDSLPFDTADAKTLQEIRQSLSVIYAKLTSYASVLLDEYKRARYLYNSQLAKSQNRFRDKDYSPMEARAAAIEEQSAAMRRMEQAESSREYALSLVDGVQQVLNSISSHIRLLENSRIRTGHQNQT